MADRFPGVAGIDLPEGWVFDGEVVAFDDQGRPDFARLQAGKDPTYVVFDVLETPGGPVVGRPLEERLSLLAEADLPGTVVRSTPIRERGMALFKAVEDQGLEGMVAKRAGSVYTPGRRSADWRKVSHLRRVRAVVGGWLEGAGGRAGSFGSLLLGLYHHQRLRYIGAVGSGFSDEQLAAIGSALREIEQPDSPFLSGDDPAPSAHWVTPAIVVVVEFKEWTPQGRLRAPVYKGVEILPPEEVTWETEKEAGEAPGPGSG